MSLKEKILQRLEEAKDPITKRRVVEVVFSLMKKKYPKAKLDVFYDENDETSGEVENWGDWSDDAEKNAKMGSKYHNYIKLSADSADELDDIVKKANMKYTQYKITWAKFGFEKPTVNIQVNPKK